MFKKLHKLSCMVLVLTLILSMTSIVFAASPTYQLTSGGISTRQVGTMSADLVRESNTSAYSHITASTFSEAEYVKATLTLQEYKSGSWVTATGVSPVTQTKTVNNTASFMMTSDWNLTSGKNYRVKVYIQDKSNGITSSNTVYTNSI